MQARNVLFLCTGNSARSVMAEALLNEHGKGRFRAFSAGSHPAGKIHPLTLETLQLAGIGVAGLRSKSWNEFSSPDAPVLDFVFTVCDNAAGEVCPIWPGQPMTAHWGIEDPAAAPEAEQERAFRSAFYALQRRIGLFLALPLESIDELALKRALQGIGTAADADARAARDARMLQRLVDGEVRIVELHVLADERDPDMRKFLDEIYNRSGSAEDIGLLEVLPSAGTGHPTSPVR